MMKRKIEPYGDGHLKILINTKTHDKRPITTEDVYKSTEYWIPEVKGQKSEGYDGVFFPHPLTNEWYGVKKVVSVIVGDTNFPTGQAVDWLIALGFHPAKDVKLLRKPCKTKPRKKIQNKK
jgi:hypothetical protein